MRTKQVSPVSQSSEVLSLGPFATVSRISTGELPEELAGETDFAERSGHHYTGTVIDSFYERDTTEIQDGP